MVSATRASASVHHVREVDGALEREWFYNLLSFSSLNLTILALQPLSASTPAPSQSAPGTSPSSNDNANQNAATAKRPYGGLVPSQPKGPRVHQDPASYNQHLAQHQA